MDLAPRPLIALNLSEKQECLWMKERVFFLFRVDPKLPRVKLKKIFPLNELCSHVGSNGGDI